MALSVFVFDDCIRVGLVLDRLEFKRFGLMGLCQEFYAALDQNDTMPSKFQQLPFNNQHSIQQSQRKRYQVRFAASNSCASSSANLFSVARSVSIFFLASSLQNLLRARI